MTRLDALKARVEKNPPEFTDHILEDIERLVAVVDIADVLMASEMQRDVGETEMVQVQFAVLKQLQDALAYWLEPSE